MWFSRVMNGKGSDFPNCAMGPSLVGQAKKCGDRAELPPELPSANPRFAAAVRDGVTLHGQHLTPALLLLHSLPTTHSVPCTFGNLPKAHLGCDCADGPCQTSISS